MRRFLAFALLLVVIVGTLAALSPSVVNANYKDPSNCPSRKLCRFEPGDPPYCPPCFYLEVCSPRCGCRPIPGCKAEPVEPLAPIHGSGTIASR